MAGKNQSTFSYAGSTVGDIVSIDFSGITREMIDKTAVGDTVVSARQSSQTDAGTVTVVVNYDPQDTEHAAIRDDLLNGQASDQVCVVTHYDNSTETFSGVPQSYKSMGIAGVDNENLQAEFVIKINTAVVHANGV